MSISSQPFLDVIKDASSGNMKTQQKNYLGSGRYPIVDQGKDLIGGYTDDASKLCNVSPPVIVFGDHTRAVKYIDFPFAMGADGTKILVPKKGDDCRYLYHAIKAIKIEEAGYSRHFKFLKESRIPLPSLEQQSRIAKILDATEALRAKRRESLDQLDALLQSTFLDLFGDPITNPLNWEMGMVGDLLESANYGTSKKADERIGQYPILRMGNITYQGGWDLSSMKYIDLDDRETKKYLVRKGDILFNRTNSKELVGKTAVYRFDEPMAFAGYLVRARVSSRADPEYIAAFMNSHQTKSRLVTMCKSIVGMANINAKEFQAIPIPIPPVGRQRKFADIVKSILCQKDFLSSHLSELDVLFSSLQQRAFSGNL